MTTDAISEDLIKQIDTETSRFRDLRKTSRFWYVISRILLIGMGPVACFFILDGPSSLKWTFVMQQYYAILVAMVLPVIFLLVPAYKGAPRSRVPVYDVVLAIVSVLIFLYPIILYPSLLMSMGVISIERIIFGTAAILIVLEAVRRMAGLVLMLLGVFFILYAVFNWAIPSPFGGKEIPWDYLVNYLFLDGNALLGSALDVTALVVLPYIMFGNFLQGVGGGKFLTDFSMSVFGGFRGGPAKVAVVASSLFGTISGSAVSNVVTTGTFTIPMMKKTGYKPHVAGAIEAVSSTGGQLMPPVMGAAAFVIAQFTGIPYTQLVVAAIIPAVLYYLGIFIQVDLEAGKMGLKGVARDQLPRLRNIWKNCYLFLIPLIVLIVALFVLNMEVGKSALVAVATCIVVGFIAPETRKNPKWIVKSLEQSGTSMLEITTIVAMAGFIIGVLTFTGLAFIFPLLLGKIAGDSLFLLLIIVAIAALILGMGMPTVAVYILLSLLLAPALIKLGVPVLAAHLFIMYWGMLSAITPPVALAAFAGAALAGASAMRTGYSAMRIGVLVYIVPFLFVLGPSLLLMGSVVDTIVSVTTALAGSYLVGVAAVGFLFRDLKVWIRLLFALAGLCLLIPVESGALHALAIVTNIVGAIVAVLVIGWEWRVKQKALKMAG